MNIASDDPGAEAARLLELHGPYEAQIFAAEQMDAAAARLRVKRTKAALVEVDRWIEVGQALIVLIDAPAASLLSQDNQKAPEEQTPGAR